MVVGAMALLVLMCQAIFQQLQQMLRALKWLPCWRKKVVALFAEGAARVVNQICWARNHLACMRLQLVNGNTHNNMQ